MKDLESHISAWRARLTAAFPHQEETVNELEAHLRDHIEVQVKRGASAEAAFAQAVARIGEPKSLAWEFAGSGSGPKWATPMVIIYAIMGLATGTMGLLVAKNAGWNGQPDPLLMIHVIFITTGYLALVTAGLLGLWTLVSGLDVPVTPRIHRIQRRELQRMAAFASFLVPVGMVLGAFWAREHRGAFWRWEPIEIGALSVLLSSWLLFAVQRWTPATEAFRAILALLGATVVALGWFGAKAVTGAVPISWLCGAALFAQGATALLHVRSRRTSAQTGRQLVQE